jgi:hypothetical protein
MLGETGSEDVDGGVEPAGSGVLIWWTRDLGNQEGWVVEEWDASGSNHYGIDWLGMAEGSSAEGKEASVPAPGALANFSGNQCSPEGRASAFSDPYGSWRR